MDLYDTWHFERNSKFLFDIISKYSIWYKYTVAHIIYNPFPSILEAIPAKIFTVSIYNLLHNDHNNHSIYGTIIKASNHRVCC